jgi:agmatine deiminase
MSASKIEGLQQPAEWALHEACWVAWPSHADLWKEALEPAREEFVALCRGIRSGATGERLEVLVPDAEQEALAAQALHGLAPRFHHIPFGDIWLRDTAPIFVAQRDGDVAALRFAFNGWGGKYVLDHDANVAARVAQASGKHWFGTGMVLEGGSVEVDGEGTCLTTRQCLLNPNRNPTLSQREIEEDIRTGLGITDFIWIDEGLLNDHTDGHIDTIARFVAPGVALCMEARGPDDPNRAVLDAIARQLAAARDARGRRLEVVRIPSPGRVENEEGRVMPASFVNFYIANEAVIVPTYGTPWDGEAVERIGALFPGRRTFGASARAILEGGGAFHCITQQQPAGGAP